MKRPHLTLSLAAATILIFSSCSQNSSENQEQGGFASIPAEIGNEDDISPELYTVENEKIEKREQVLDEETYARTSDDEIYVATGRTTEQGVHQVTYEMADEEVEKEFVLPDYDNRVFSASAVKYFAAMSKEFAGKPYFLKQAHAIEDTILSILSTNCQHGTDLVLLVDKTGSMEDDLEHLRLGMEKIKNFLKHFQNVRLGIASYSDRNYHDSLWYNAIPLGDDLEKIDDFLDSYSTIGNPDTPESVNDALMRTVNTMNWKEGNRKVILVIGDAPSQEPPRSHYSSDSVVAYCKRHNISFNLYPIIVASANINWNDPEAVVTLDASDVKVFPNPTNVGYIDLQSNFSGPLYYHIFDMQGKELRKASMHDSGTKRIRLDGFKVGTYFIQMYDRSMTKTRTQRFVVVR